MCCAAKEKVKQQAGAAWQRKDGKRLKKKQQHKTENKKTFQTKAKKICITARQGFR